MTTQTMPKQSLPTRPRPQDDWPPADEPSPAAELGEDFERLEEAEQIERDRRASRK